MVDHVLIQHFSWTSDKVQTRILVTMKFPYCIRSIQICLLFLHTLGVGGGSVLGEGGGGLKKTKVH